MLTGRLLFGEAISRLQRLACLLAAIGVGNELLGAASLSWPVLAVALGYPCYFALRRRMGTANLGGLWLDLVISLPVAALFAVADRDTLQLLTASPRLLVLIAGLGALSALALALMIVASKHLNLALFSLLSYVEPVLLVVVALLLGETIVAGQWLTYGAIWAAIGVLVVEGVAALRRSGGASTRPG